MDNRAHGTWAQPRLVVLARSGPEEAVLWTCKNDTTTGGPNPGQGNKNTGCKTTPTSSCPHCAAGALS
jgi:hypothetical protein